MSVGPKNAWLSLGWLTGPIFGKELRVSSRRKRNFWLRGVYVLLLMIFITVVWMSVTDHAYNTALQQSRTAVAGKEIVTTTVLFQFVAMQVLAVIMLSTAISDEIYHRTLGLLMTTPITGLQIVMGKILSKLLQLLLLLAITLPVLAIVRVFGGVAWSYLFSSFCVTVTAVLLAGCVSLVFSIGNRRAYAVIVRTMFVLGCLYFAVPGVLTALFQMIMVPGQGFLGDAGSQVSRGVLTVMWHLNPFYAIWYTTQKMLLPGQTSGYHWPVHCGAILGMSLLVLAWAVRVVRRIALRQATGQIDPALKPRKRRWKRRAKASATAEPVPVGPIKRVVGPPVVWKELRAPFIQGIDSRNSYIGLAMTIVALGITYAVSAREGVLGEDFVHISYALLFIVMGIILGVVFAATRITAEKESQTWPLLLATSLSDWEILLGKAVSAFRRNVPIWGLLAGHLVLYVCVGYIHPIAIVHSLILVTWLMCFITSTGLYFSVRFTRTTSAVVASFALVVALWVVIPMLLGTLGVVGKGSQWFEDCAWFHPIFQAEVIMAGGAGADSAKLPLGSLRYKGPQGMLGIERTSFTLGYTALVYLVVSLIFFWGAKHRLRRCAF